MINFRVITRVFSLLLILEGLFMLLSAGVSFIYGEKYNSLLFPAIITIVVGIIAFTPLRDEEKMSGNREGYIIVTGIWLLYSLFGSLPYLFSGTASGFTDAFFESMSGFTTTGATIMTDVELLPKGILFWRSLTQWIGGIGIIFISLSILPLVKAINVQLAIADFSGQSADRIRPRIKDVAKRLILIYIIITVAEILLLLGGGMNIIDAVCHSFSTISTGGFSTRNGGISAFSSPFIRIVITIFMFIAGTNLAIIYFLIKRNLQRLFTNSEFIAYVMVCSSAIILASAGLFLLHGRPLGEALMNGAFHVISVITTTGFYTENYNLWNNVLIFMFFILMFTGGTSGSSSGNIKMVRVLLLVKTSRQEMKRTIHPSAYVPVRLDNKIVPQPVIHNVIVFLILWFIIVCIGSFLFSLMGYDIITSFSTAAAMLGNIGPGLGEFGAFSDYSSVPGAGKWLLSVLMVLGRLELITVLILFSRKFYRK